METPLTIILKIIWKLRGFIYLVVVFFVLSGLKIGGIINWSWWIVVAPLLPIFVILIIAILFVTLISKAFGIPIKAPVPKEKNRTRPTSWYSQQAITEYCSIHGCELDAGYCRKCKKVID